MATWRAAQLRTFLAAVRSDELAALWTVLAMTGMRRGEALGLRWCDVDLDRRRLAIRRTRVVIGHQVIDSEPKSARGRRVVALDALTTAVLGRLPRGDAEDLVFVRADGSPPHPTWVTRRFARLIAAWAYPASGSTTSVTGTPRWRSRRG